MSEAAQSASDESHVRVMLRVRPFNQRERDASAGKDMKPVVTARGAVCALLDSNGRETEAFGFDDVFWSLPASESGMCLSEFADQRFVYERSGKVGLDAAWEGYNVALFAYGQTSSGKTHTMFGSDTDPGITFRLIDDLFARIDQARTESPALKVTVTCGFFEIYNERVRDLLKNIKAGDGNVAKIRLHPTEGVFIEGLERKDVTSAAAIRKLVERGFRERTSGATAMNEHSSRSHAIFQLRLSQSDAATGRQRAATINLVDLAGAERVSQSLAANERLTEAANINKSLMCLRRVIDTLQANAGKPPQRQVKPQYRDSVLTFVLSDCLGGNSKTMMVATISPHEENTSSTVSTLRYALKAKSIVCSAQKNEKENLQLMADMRQELLKLRDALRTGATPALLDADGKPASRAEVQAQIELREREVKKLQTEQQDMHERLATLQQENNAASIKLKQSRAERFAQTFRNAFKISAQRQQRENHVAEIASLRQELDDARNAADEARSAHAEAAEALAREAANAARDREQQHEEALGQRDHLLSQLRRQLESVCDENRNLKVLIEGHEAKSAKLRRENEDLQRRMQRLADESLAATHRESTSHATHDAAAERLKSELAEARDATANVRKRKDHYKLQLAETAAALKAHETLAAGWLQERAALTATLKAQQSMLEQQSAASVRAHDDRRREDNKVAALEAKAEKHLSESRLLGEAMREYEAAAAGWMLEVSQLQKEVAMLRRFAPPEIAAAGKAAIGAGGPTHGASRQHSTDALTPPRSTHVGSGLMVEGGAWSGSQRRSPRESTVTTQPRSGSGVRARHADPSW